MASPRIDDIAARVGQCMHRLLELYRVDVDLKRLAPNVAASFQLTETQAAQALQATMTILDGDASWVWDADQMDWHANEVEIMYEGQLLRLDRLIKHRATQIWWVLDYKSNPAPERVVSLVSQLKQYQAAVQAAYPKQAVKAAFITALGAFVEI